MQSRNDCFCIFLLVTSIGSSLQSFTPPCDSEIFCYGPVLEAAQNAHIYNDSKSFVDMKMKHKADVILSSFKQLNASNHGNLTDSQVKKFIEENFSPPNSEFEEWVPDDWKSRPAFLSNISDPKLQKWAQELNDLWKVLGRKITEDVKKNSSLYSFIPVENPVIVPGGRFREFYYWDTYWMIRGLLLSEMTTTVKGMLKNFLFLVDTFGFVPNGGRIYYEERSQPPFLIPMFDEHMQATGDVEFLKSSLPTLEKEYKFWMENRSIEVSGQKLNYYASDVNLPRPESYREDVDAIKELSEEQQKYLMTAITSACESGWDFSSRWCGINYNTKENVVSQLKTRDIIPVDLNSILALNERILAKFHQMLGNESKAASYDEKYKARVQAIETLLWNGTDGMYYDYVIPSNQHNRQYYASNMNPLWTKCFPETVDIISREIRMVQYLQENKILDHPGGIPTSLRQSGEQWDFPNAWPPLVHMIIEGMSTSKDSALQKEAFKQAQKWVNVNYKAYTTTYSMFEKYDVRTEEGLPGHGGEYDVQIGFGWTNGVILSFLDKYGFVIAANSVTTTTSLPDDVTSTPDDAVMHTTNDASIAGSSSITSFVAFLLSLLAL